MTPLLEEEGPAGLPGYGALLAIILLFFVAGVPLQSWDVPFGLGYSELFCLAFPVAIVLLSQGLDPVRFLGLGRPRPASLLAAAVVAGVGYGFAGALNSLNNALFTPEMLERFNPARLFHGGPAAQVMLVVSVTLLAPLGEESLFRGYALPVFAARKGPRFGVLFTASIFAVMHLNPTEVLALFALGAIFGLLRLQSGSLWSPLLAHAIQNGVSSILVLSGVADGPPDVMPVKYALLLLGVTGPALFWALRWHERVSRPPAPLGEMAPARVTALPVIVVWLVLAGVSLAAFALLRR